MPGIRIPRIAIVRRMLMILVQFVSAKPVGQVAQIHSGRQGSRLMNVLLTSNRSPYPPPNLWSIRIWLKNILSAKALQDPTKVHVNRTVPMSSELKLLVWVFWVNYSTIVNIARKMAPLEKKKKIQWLSSKNFLNMINSWHKVCITLTWNIQWK